MMVRREVTVVGIVLLVTVPLLIFSANPKRLAHIDVHPNTLIEVRLLSTSILTEPGARDVIYFDFRALTEDSTVKTVSVSIRPFVVAEWFESQEMTVSRGLILGTLQLGSVEYPVTRAGEFGYKLVADGNRVLSEGTIKVRCTSVGVHSRGLLARSDCLHQSSISQLSFLEGSVSHLKCDRSHESYKTLCRQ